MLEAMARSLYSEIDGEAVGREDVFDAHKETKQKKGQRACLGASQKRRAGGVGTYRFRGSTQDGDHTGLSGAEWHGVSDVDVNIRRGSGRFYLQTERSRISDMPNSKEWGLVLPESLCTRIQNIFCADRRTNPSAMERVSRAQKSNR